MLAYKEINRLEPSSFDIFFADIINNRLLSVFEQYTTNRYWWYQYLDS